MAGVERAGRGAAAVYHRLRQSKSLRVVLLVVAVGAFVLFLSERDSSHLHRRRRGDDARGLLSLSQDDTAAGGALGDVPGIGGGGVSFGERLVACQKQLKGFLGTGGTLSQSQEGEGTSSLLFLLQREKDALEAKLKQKKESLCGAGSDLSSLGGGSEGEGEGGSGRLLAAMKTEKELLQTQLTIALEQANSLGGGGGQGGGAGAFAGGPYETRQLRLENEVLRAAVLKLGRSGSRGGRGSDTSVTDASSTEDSGNTEDAAAAALTVENTVLKAQVKQLEAQLKAAQDVPKADSGALESLKAEVSAQNAQVKQLEAQLKAAQDANSAAAADGGGAEKAESDAVASLKAEISVLNAQVKQLESQLKAAQDTSSATATDPAAGSGPGGEPCPKCACDSAPPGAGAGSAEAAAEMEGLRKKVEHAETLVERLMTEKRQLTRVVAECSGNMSSAAGAGQLQGLEAQKALEAAKQAIAECGAKQGVPAFEAGSKLYGCQASDEELKRYLNYTAREQCPDDWYFIQYLVYVKSCHCLPRRRCFAPAPPEYKEPSIPFPESLFDPAVLSDRNVRWEGQYWPSYEALNSRKLGDCRDCFNLTLESNRWQNNYRGTIPIDHMLSLKGKGAIKIGLDAGGGTGSFAAKMAQHGVTIVTTAMNTETLPDKELGLPYMETIAQRGLVPLHVPHQARQPFFDGTLDIIHNINSVKYFTPMQFEELLFEWDRILRPGGILWFELFYAPVNEMPLYIAVLDIFGYKKLYWNMAPKTDAPEREGAHIYLNCVLEKPRRAGAPPKPLIESSGKEEVIDKESGAKEEVVDKESGGKEEVSDKESVGKEEVSDKQSGGKEEVSDKESGGKEEVSDKESGGKEEVSDKDSVGKEEVSDKEKGADK